MVDFILGLGLALPIASSSSIATVTGVAQGVSEQKKHNADQANQARMLKFHLDVAADTTTSARRMNGRIVTLRSDKLWLDERDPATRQPSNTSHHPFTGFFLAYPDSNRAYTRGLVSTISRNPPMLNWIYIDRETHEVKYASKSGSIEHHVGSYDWTDDEERITFDEWEGFLAIEEDSGQWALYFDKDDDGLASRKSGNRRCEVDLVRRLIPAQEINKWGLKEDGNIGFRATKEIDKISGRS